MTATSHIRFKLSASSSSWLTFSLFIPSTAGALASGRSTATAILLRLKGSYKVSQEKRQGGAESSRNYEDDHRIYHQATPNTPDAFPHGKRPVGMIPVSFLDTDRYNISPWRDTSTGLFSACSSTRFECARVLQHVGERQHDGVRSGCSAMWLACVCVW